MATEREKERERDRPPKEAGKNDRPLSPLRRAIEQAMGRHREFGAPDDPAKELYPSLWEMLAQVHVGSKHLREPSSIRIQLGPGGVLLQVNDRQFGYVYDAGCPHLGDILRACEERVNDLTRPPRVVGRKEPKLRKRDLGK